MRALISGLVVLAFVSDCQSHHLPTHKAAKLARTSDRGLPANPIVQKWTLPSGEAATLLVRWKPFSPPEEKPIDMHGMSDLFPATEPTPHGMRQRVKVTLP